MVAGKLIDIAYLFLWHTKTDTAGNEYWPLVKYTGIKHNTGL